MKSEPARVCRGGSWDDARVPPRDHFAPGRRNDDLGVRLIRIMQPLQQLAEVVKNGE